MCDDLNKCVRLRNIYELRLHYSWEAAICVLTHRNRCVVLTTCLDWFSFNFILTVFYSRWSVSTHYRRSAPCMELQLDSSINMRWKCVSNLHNLTFLMRQQRTLLFYEQERHNITSLELLCQVVPAYEMTRFRQRLVLISNSLLL